LRGQTLGGLQHVIERCVLWVATACYRWGGESSGLLRRGGPLLRARGLSPPRAWQGDPAGLKAQHTTDEADRVAAALRFGRPGADPTLLILGKEQAARLPRGAL